LSTVSTTSPSITTTKTATASAAKAAATTQPSKNVSDSSIDWGGLIDEAVNAKLFKATSLDLKIEDNDLKIAAYEQAKSLLTTMQNAAQALRSPSGTSTRATDVFLSRSAYLTANGNVSATNTFSATVDPASDPGNYKVEVVQLAAAHKISSGSVATKTSDLNLAGTFSLGVAGSDPVEISVTTDMSLMEVAEAINRFKTNSGVQASIVQVSPDDFRLVLSAVKTGQNITAETSSGDDVLGVLGLTDTNGAFTNVLQDAKQAIIRVDDLEVVRSTNEISDVINGTTLYLYQTTPPDTSITLEVGANAGAVKSAILQLVEAYNAYRDFAIEQQTLPSAKNDPKLFGDSTMRTLNSAIGEALNTTFDSLALGAMGITFDIKNKLVIDEDKLDNILLTDLKSVQNIFDFQMTSSNTNVQLLSRGASAPADFTLDIETDASGAMVSAKVNGAEGMFTISGTRIVGVAGTAYEGLSLVYSSSSSASVDISFKTGIAEKLYNIANGATNSKSGTLVNLVNGLQSNNTEMSVRSDNIRAQADTFRTTLTMRYARFQAAISMADAMKDYLSTLLDTWNAKS
jgi:flagellar hook-associated protein 2